MTKPIWSISKLVGVSGAKMLDSVEKFESRMLAEARDEIAPLNQLFNSFDLNNDGIISPDEKL
jgi:Ca2+-binding EF-hand superfamily protein